MGGAYKRNAFLNTLNDVALAIVADVGRRGISVTRLVDALEREIRQLRSCSFPVDTMIAKSTTSFGEEQSACWKNRSLPGNSCNGCMSPFMIDRCPAYCRTRQASLFRTSRRTHAFRSCN